ncbi:DUF6882 domain-containing protein [Micromonospora echinofusca]|nr:DUF6882 domain-containing protein [Micromonospora echinofusca]
MNALHMHLSHTLAPALARQLALADLLGERGWQVDINAGTVTFGDDLTYPIQLLGTESQGDGTWLWAWANSDSQLPPALLRAAEWLRGYGREHDIPELTGASHPLDRADGHLLALLAGGLTGQSYYRGPYPGGALFFLVEQLPAAVTAPVAPQRVLTVLTQAIQMYPVDHRTLVDGFLRQQGYTVTATPDDVSGQRPDGSTIRVSFDPQGRITNIAGAIRPADA